MMKKVFLFFAAATLFALGMTSCQKDQTVVKYRATIERTTAKTSVENLNNINVSHPVVWESGDEITIFRTRDGQPFTFVTDDNNTDEAVFHLASQGDCSGLHGEAVTAGYPADYFHHQGQLQIPTIQNYKNHNVIKYPMYAVAGSGTDELAFKNLCGILRIKMPKYQTTDLQVNVTKVVVWTNQQISGIFDIQNAASTNPTLWPVSGPDEIIMNFATPINLNGSDYEYIYIYLPAADYTTLAFQFYNTTASEGKYLEVKSNQTIAINRSQVHTIDLTHITPAREHWTDTPEPPSPDFYSVSETLQVNFAKGNLVYNGSTWGIAPNQQTVYFNEGGMIDLFARSTYDDGNNFGVLTMSTNEEYHTPNTDVLHYGIAVESEGWPVFSGTYKDWGLAVDANNAWRTLSAGEWDHLMHKRARAFDLHYFVYVENDEGDDFCGLFIFPDGWTNHHNISLNNSSYITVHPNDYGEDVKWENFYRNIITKSDFDDLAAEGTFFPASGVFFDQYACDKDIHRGGYYWTSSITACQDSYDHHPTQKQRFEQIHPYYDDHSEYGNYYYGEQQVDAEYFGLSACAVRLAYNAMQKSSNNESWSPITSPATIPAITPNTTSSKRRK